MDLRANAIENYRLHTDDLSFTCAAQKRLACSRNAAAAEKLGKKTPSGETSSLYLHKYAFFAELPFVKRNTHTHKTNRWLLCVCLGPPVTFFVISGAASVFRVAHNFIQHAWISSFKISRVH